jgi:hypothetical protein
LSSHTPRKVALHKKLRILKVRESRSRKNLHKLKLKYSEKLANIYKTCTTNVDQLINEIGKHVTGDRFNFIAHQLKMANKPPKAKRYSDEIKLLSLSLYNSGPKAYAYLSDIFNLPSKTSLKNWLKNLSSSPGFLPETFNALEQRMKFMSERDKVCALLFDEITLKKNLQYDRYRDSIVGFEDFAHIGRSDKYAGSALVFMLRGLAANWSQPVGYVFSCTGCKDTVVQDLLFRCIDKCTASGCHIKVVISDQDSNFFAMSKKLGISVEQPYFKYNGNQYFFMFDTPHLLKSTRNNLYKHSFHYDNLQTSWDVIVNYFNIDVKQEWRMTPKITSTHVYLPPFSKMKVKFASQICSRSLAGALTTHEKILGINTKATANFLVKFNDLFDAVNSSQAKLKNSLKGALSDTSPHIPFLKNCLQWLSTVTVMNGKVPVKNVKCLIGWQISISSILQLWTILRDNYKFDFLLTRRLNQDPLENLFSVIRRKGGNCYTPTPYNFAHIYKQTVCQKLLNPIKTGNCEMDLTKILTTLSACNNKITNSMNNTFQNGNKGAVISVRNYCVIPAVKEWKSESVKCLEDNAFHYVCGYIQKKI